MNTIAFDPGIRTFQTGYTNKGQLVEYGNQDIQNICRLAKQMDKLHSKIDKYQKDEYSSKQERTYFKNQRRRWRKRIGLLGNRIQNLKRDMHWKLAREIVQQNKHILCSRFQVSQMIKKETRKIKKEIIKQMLHWSHYQFRQRLKHKAREYGSIVHELGEHYSSKGCG